MEVLDENGDLITWLSDDPDDWNSFSDYENRVRRMVLELNEELFYAGCHLLGYNGTNALGYIKLLGNINSNYTSDPNLQEKLREVRRWSNYRMTSCHPDNEDRLFQEVQIADESYHMDGLGGIQRDIKKAVEYYEIGAEDEIGDCAFILGLLYRDGADGLSPNMELAYNWIRKAALLETCNAGNALGQLFENGWGCEKNLRKALYWYDVSMTGIENGNQLRKVLA